MTKQLRNYECPKCFHKSRSQKAYSEHALTHFGGASSEIPFGAYSNPITINKALKVAATLRGGHPTSALGYRELAPEILLKQRLKEIKKKDWSEAEKTAYMMALLV